jgi:hypothetical protein
VHDPTGTAIPKAKITIKDGQDEEIARGLTDRWACLWYRNFRPGPYGLTISPISLRGFQKYANTLLVQQHSVANVPVTLAVQPIPDAVRHGESSLNLVLKDKSAAVIPTVHISVTQVATGPDFDGETNQAGTFQAGGLASGDYAVTAKVTGFKTGTQTVLLNAPESRQITLKVAAATRHPPGPGPNLLVEPLTSTVNPEHLPQVRPDDSS